ncbi:MazG nucleotide pyrophosphohydrolase domain-containing protein [Rufibacter quisquiliarum]|uniref:NTP pyrophosphatase (Non-canonical NTP hydrolase) n=1 Tax=Rufibacter quisquiliarum TaxID=1549639 RepID=A0A839GT69_9BACT|nr:MazG nucleotide pyrophosphohydrolase domain-containing protein [Rufibacter quisquiliarum]MBA9077608.1 NTP pyrophosphatase (non-canonical NTP hydrolase) [Rufibacter quisquiliarum]
MEFSHLTHASRLRNQTSAVYHNCLDWSLADWSNAIAGETGEMCNLIKKIRRGDSIDVKDVGKELADIVIYADLLADQLGLDLGECVRQKFNEVSDRIGSNIKV